MASKSYDNYIITGIEQILIYAHRFLKALRKINSIEGERLDMFEQNAPGVGGELEAT